MALTLSDIKNKTIKAEPNFEISSKKLIKLNDEGRLLFAKKDIYFFKNNKKVLVKKGSPLLFLNCRIYNQSHILSRNEINPAVQMQILNMKKEDFKRFLFQRINLVRVYFLYDKLIVSKVLASESLLYIPNKFKLTTIKNSSLYDMVVWMNEKLVGDQMG